VVSRLSNALYITPDCLSENRNWVRHELQEMAQDIHLLFRNGKPTDATEPVAELLNRAPESGSARKRERPDRAKALVSISLVASNHSAQ
jgi:hypothetical protein